MNNAALVMYQEILEGVPKDKSKVANESPERAAMWDRIAKEVEAGPPEGGVWDIPFDGLTDGSDEDGPAEQ